MNYTMKRNKLDSLIILRAIAVAAVCFCHFGYALQAENFYNPLFIYFYEYGKYGVQVFFVVSGFVIPLSLFMARYTLKHYFRFLQKRVIRLHPPYLAALVITLLIASISYRVRGVAYPETVESVAQSLFYVHFPADNPVFWTLAVEAQYYLFIGLVYGLIVKTPKLFLFGLTPGLILIGQSALTEYVLFFSYILYFLIGIVGFMIYTKQGQKPLNLAVLVVLLGFTYVLYGVVECTVSAAAIGFILGYQRAMSKSVEFVGEISYSLYLIHFPIGIKFINLLNRYVSASDKWVLFMLTIVVTTLLSWAFYKLFEEPFAKLSNRIKYNAPAPAYPVLEPEV